jgi:hypothetical protein
MALKGKILIELDYEYFEKEGTSGGSYVSLTHPDLTGLLSFKTSSERLAGPVLDHLSAQTNNSSSESVSMTDQISKIKDEYKEILAAMGLKL